MVGVAPKIPASDVRGGTHDIHAVPDLRSTRQKAARKAGGEAGFRMNWLGGILPGLTNLRVGQSDSEDPPIINFPASRVDDYGRADGGRPIATAVKLRVIHAASAVCGIVVKDYYQGLLHAKIHFFVEETRDEMKAG